MSLCLNANLKTSLHISFAPNQLPKYLRYYVFFTYDNLTATNFYILQVYQSQEQKIIYILWWVYIIP